MPHPVIVRLHMMLYDRGGHLTSSNTLSSFSNQNSTFSDSSMLGPWNSSAPCLLTVSIEALRVANISNTQAMSCDILSKAFVGSLGTLLFEGSEADNSCSLGLTLSTLLQDNPSIQNTRTSISEVNTLLNICMFIL